MNVKVSKDSGVPQSKDNVSAGANVNLRVSGSKSADASDSSISEHTIEHIVSLMAMLGLKSVSVSRYSSGLACRIHSTVMPFDGVPESVLVRGVIAKDAIGQLAAVSGLTKVEINASPEEYARLYAAWKSMDDAPKAPGIPVVMEPESQSEAHAEESVGAEEPAPELSGAGES